jgi:peptidyl-prolyl cis-trans isomerase C
VCLASSRAVPSDVVDTVPSSLDSDKQEMSSAKVQSFASVWRLKSILGEPLVHFLAAGFLLLSLGAAFDRARSPVINSLEVSAAAIEQLREVWTAQWGHPPDPAQMKGLIADYVRDEIFYREALASGLDKNDTIIHRRLIEKMEFLSQEFVSASEPTETQLRKFFEQNASSFQVPARVSFLHIYFSSSRRGIATERDARKTLTRLLSSRKLPLRLESLGDAFMLQYEYSLQTRDQVKQVFGDQFAKNLFALEPGIWSGPIASSYGLHLVRVSNQTSSRIPDFNEVRGQVALGFANQQLRTASDSFYEAVRKRYRVKVDQSATSTPHRVALQ